MPRADDRIDIPAPVVGVQLGWRSWAVIGAATVFGLLALLWPFVIPAPTTMIGHPSDAPFVFAAMLPLILLLVLAQVADGSLDAKSLAVLGVLAAVNAVLRPALGAGTAGIESVYFLLILAGRVFGPGFGFLLGNTSMFASALLTAGVGPWLPFQMMAAGWIGMGAGLLPKRPRGRGELVMLIAYGILCAYAFGLVLNLWSWPFIASTTVEGVAAGSIDYVPGAPVWDNLVAFGWYTLLTSTAGWDSGRAITTTLALLVLGKPLLVVLRRASGMARTYPDAVSAERATVTPVAS